VRRRHFDPILTAAKVKGVTLHGLRHAMTSFGISEGISPKVLAERLGHSTTKLTQDRYAHVLPGIQKQAAATIDALLAPKSKG
jgi:integrase